MGTPPWEPSCHSAWLPICLHCELRDSPNSAPKKQANCALILSLSSASFLGRWGSRSLVLSFPARMSGMDLARCLLFHVALCSLCLSQTRCPDGPQMYPNPPLHCLRCLTLPSYSLKSCHLPFLKGPAERILSGFSLNLHFYCSTRFTLYLVFPFTFFLFLHLSVSLSVCLSFPLPPSTYPTWLNCKLFEASFWDLHEYIGRRAVIFTFHCFCPRSLWVRRLPSKPWLSHLQAWLPLSPTLKHPPLSLFTFCPHHGLKFPETYSNHVSQPTACFFLQKSSVVSDSLRPHRLYSPWNSPGQNTGEGCHSLLQEIFPTQGSNPGLPHCRRILYQLSHQGSPPKS